VWKENVLVLVGLYPTVILFSVVVAPHLAWTGDALGMLLGNVVTVGLLGWPLLPWLRRRFAWWLHAAPGDRRTDLRGGATLAAVIGALTGLAHLLVSATGGLP
jgi:antibiotic biosynthesis monooxygenase (ABM) superfamily enzyme